MSKTIGILGCGWLGTPLAYHLQSRGHTILGTTTQEQKAEILRKSGIQAYQIRLGETGFQGDIDAFLTPLDTLVFNIPPGLRRNPEGDYPARIAHLRNALIRNAVPHLVYVSSTSVFGSSQGEVDESIQPDPDGENGRQLLQAEQLLAARGASYQILTVRLGGLIGPDRHPVKFLSGRTGLSGGSDPVNLIHQGDAIRLLTQAAEDPDGSGTVHAVYPDHPTKKAYYTAFARHFGIAPPEYENAGAADAKIIRSAVLEARGFDWAFPIG